MEYTSYDSKKSLDTDGWETITVKKKKGSIKTGVAWTQTQDIIEMNIEKTVFREIPRICHHPSRPGSDIHISWGNC